MTKRDRGRQRPRAALLAALGLAALAVAAPAGAQESREAAIAREQAQKASALTPPQPGRIERFLNDFEEAYVLGKVSWHPWFESAYAGGGFVLGAGWGRHVSPYNMIDLRGSYTIHGYKRLEAEFLAPRLLDDRAQFSLIGGWREATQVGFYGFGTANTSADDRVNYSFSQPYGQATLTARPARRYLVLAAGLEFTKWDQGSGGGSFPSVEEVYTPGSLPGLGASPTYLHAQGTAAIDWRPAADYARRGGYYGVRFHDFADQDDAWGFQQVDYEAIQHIPVLRDAWVLSLRGRVQTTFTKNDQVIPFFMLPALGGGSSLRGFSSWRFRDRHSLLLSAEWRVLANRYLDMAVFCDAGKVAARRSDLDLEGLKTDYGLGFRFHGPATTPLRIELATSNERDLKLVFSAKAAF